MKLLFKLEIVISAGCGLQSNQFIELYWESTFQMKETYVCSTENFIRSLVDKYGRHTVYTLIEVPGTFKPVLFYI